MFRSQSRKGRICPWTRGRLPHVLRKFLGFRLLPRYVIKAQSSKCASCTPGSFKVDYGSVTACTSCSQGWTTHSLQRQTRCWRCPDKMTTARPALIHAHSAAQAHTTKQPAICASCAHQALSRHSQEHGPHPFPRQDAVRPRQQQHHFVCGPPVVHTLPGRHLSWQPSLSPRLHPVFPSPRTLSLHHQPLAWLYRLLLRAGNHQLCQPAGFCGSHSDDSARIHIIVGSEVSQICSKHRVDLSAHLGETGVARNDMVSRSIHRPVTSTVSHPSPA